jgi:hypothetical protein
MLLTLYERERPMIYTAEELAPQAESPWPGVQPS